MLCLCFAACERNEESIQPVGHSDAELELLIEDDASQLWDVVQGVFQGYSEREIARINTQLEQGAVPADLLPAGSARQLDVLHTQIVERVSSLSYSHDQDQLIGLFEEISSKKARNRTVRKALDTPCFDAWDIQMGAIAATYFTCLAYSRTWVNASKCSVVAAIASTAAELTYQNCMEQYE